MWNADRSATPYISAVCHVVKKIGIAGWLILLLTVCQQLNAQNEAINLQVKIRVPTGDTRFDSLLHLITRQTGVKFSVNTRKYSLSRTMHIGKSVLSLGDVLAVIHEKSGIYYTALGNHIIFIDNPPRQINALNRSMAPPPLKKQATIKNTKKRAIKTTQTPATQTHRLSAALTLEQLPIPAPPATVISIALENNATAPTQTAKPLSDSISRVTTRSAEERPHNNLLRSSWEKITAIQLPSLQQGDEQTTAGRRSLFSPEIKTGITADETFYLNPTIHVGWRFLYGIASWSTNFNMSGFRYGGGVAVGISDDWRMHLAVTTGKLEKSYDTSGFVLQSKATLNRIALIGEKKLREKWRFQIGVTYCMLHTTYYRDGVPTPPFLNENQVKELLNPLNPVYTITDSYNSDKTRHNQSWIGLQIGIFYQINFSKRR